MKILSVSDSHGCFERFYEICLLEKPDIILFSGDGAKDAMEMEFLFPGIKFYIVKGNCDYYEYTVEDEVLIELEGLKVFLTHGHVYGVNRNYSELIKKSFTKDLDIPVIGHTHIPDRINVSIKEKEMVLFNPGAILNNSYGIIEIKEDNKVKFTHKILA